MLVVHEEIDGGDFLIVRIFRSQDERGVGLRVEVNDENFFIERFLAQRMREVDSRCRFANAPFLGGDRDDFAMPYSFEPSEYADKGVRVNSGRDELSRYFRQYTIEGSVNEPLQVPDFVPEIVI